MFLSYIWLCLFLWLFFLDRERRNGFFSSITSRSRDALLLSTGWANSSGISDEHQNRCVWSYTLIITKKDQKWSLFLSVWHIIIFHTFSLMVSSFCLSQVLSMLLSPLERFGWGVCWCWVCVESMRQRSAVHCSVVGCNVLYCAQCWRDLGNCCICSIPKDMEPQDNDSDTDTVYYVH